MKPRHVLAAAFVVLESPLLAVLVVGSIAGAVLCGAASVIGGLVRLLSLLWARYRIRRRWVHFLPPLLVFPIALLATWLFASEDADTDTFLRDYSGFFQTAAQVLAALLVAVAIEARAPKSVEDEVATRPAIALTVTLVVAAELGAVSALSPSLPETLYRLVLCVTVGAGVAALLAVILISRRILDD